MRVSESLVLKAQKALADYPYNYVTSRKLARLIGCLPVQAGSVIRILKLQQLNSKQWIVPRRSQKSKHRRDGVPLKEGQTSL
jgi:hypothetical protein